MVFDILSVCLRESNKVIFTDVQYVDIQFKCPLYFVSFKIVKFYFCLNRSCIFFLSFLDVFSTSRWKSDFLSRYSRLPI